MRGQEQREGSRPRVVGAPRWTPLHGAPRRLPWRHARGRAGARRAGLRPRAGNRRPGEVREGAAGAAGYAAQAGPAAKEAISPPPIRIISSLRIETESVCVPALKLTVSTERRLSS